MNDSERSSHLLIARLGYLMTRLEGEFFHLQPDLEANGASTSVALSSILNEAVNLVEGLFPGDSFFPSLKQWAEKQDWTWNEITIRFTWWPVCEELRPFHCDQEERLTLAGRDANNAVKHQGKLANLRDTVGAVAAAWFLILERARESEIFLDPVTVIEISRIFDCFDLLTIHEGPHAPHVGRPMARRVEYPLVRGKSEIPLAEAAFNRRAARYEERRGVRRAGQSKGPVE